MIAALITFIFLSVEVVTGGFFLLRSLNCLFFMAGVFVALNGRQNFIPPLWLGVIAFVVGEGVRHIFPVALLAETAGMFLFEIPRRAAISLLMWWFCALIVRHGGQARETFLTVEPYIFAIFCSHALTIEVLKLWLETIRAPLDALTVALAFAVQFVVCVVIGVFCSKLSKRPAIARLIPGSRTGSAQNNPRKPSLT